MTETFAQLLRAAESAVEDDPSAAFQTLRRVLAYPGRVDDPDDLAEALRVLSEVCEALEDAELARFVDAARRAPHSTEPLYELGYELIERGVDDVAATFLSRGHQLAPQDPHMLYELVCALEGIQQSSAVCELLREQPEFIRAAFLSRYFLSFHSVLQGELAEPRQLVSGLLEDAAGPDQTAMAQRLQRFLRRADAVQGATPLDGFDLRGWHYVLTGGLLTHLSPYGYEDGMSGRYAMLYDQLSTCRLGIERLARVLEAWDRSPRVVVAPPERGAATLAHAVARRLGSSLGRWDAAWDAQTLVVAYDLALLTATDLEDLRDRRGEALLFAHASCWTRPFPLAADVVTLLYQHNTPPWGEGLRVDPETRSVETTPADVRAPSEIATELLEADFAEDETFPGEVETLLALAAAADPEAAGERMYAGSPVHSHRLL